MKENLFLRSVEYAKCLGTLFLFERIKCAVLVGLWPSPWGDQSGKIEFLAIRAVFECDIAF